MECRSTGSATLWRQSISEDIYLPCLQFKGASGTQRQGDDETVLKLALKEGFVVSMPTHRVVAILVKVQVARVWPVLVSVSDVFLQ